MVKKYRKKPVEIDAVQWTGSAESLSEVFNFCDSTRVVVTDGTKKVLIPTPGGDQFVDVGDYIIKGTKGEFYPCKPDIFAVVHEEVD